MEGCHHEYECDGREGFPISPYRSLSIMIGLDPIHVKVAVHDGTVLIQRMVIGPPCHGRALTGP
jgi:hypothetical protein